MEIIEDTFRISGALSIGLGLFLLVQYGSYWLLLIGASAYAVGISVGIFNSWRKRKDKGVHNEAYEK